MNEITPRHRLRTNKIFSSKFYLHIGINWTVKYGFAQTYNSDCYLMKWMISFTQDILYFWIHPRFTLSLNHSRCPPTCAFNHSKT